MVQVSEILGRVCGERIRKLRELADSLENVQFGTNVASLTGASVGIVGGGLGIAAISLALAPVTFGASLIFGLSVAGGVVGGAGAATGITSVVTRYSYQKHAMKIKNELKEKYKSEASQMQAVSAKLGDICNKGLGSYDSGAHLKYSWKEEYTKSLTEISDHVNSLSEIYLVIESMVENNNISIVSEDGDEIINIDELITLEDLLDRFDYVCGQLHLIMGGDDLEFVSLQDDSDSESDLDETQNIEDGIPGAAGSTGTAGAAGLNVGAQVYRIIIEGFNAIRV